MAEPEPQQEKEERVLPSPDVDIMKTDHVRVFARGTGSPQEEVLLRNQLLEIQQGQETRRMLAKMIDEKERKTKHRNTSQKKSAGKKVVWYSLPWRSATILIFI